MKWPQRIFDFYMEASIHVALAVVSLSLATAHFLDIFLSSELLIFTFCATVSCYNYLKHHAELKKGITWYQGDQRYMAILSIICLLAALFVAIKLPVQDFLLLGVLSILIAFYIFPIIPRDKNLRSLGIVKVVIVAFIWTGVTVFLPVLSNNYPISWDLFVLSLQRFLLVLALIIPFEIRDMYLDPPGIRTLPRRLGIKRTKQLGVLLATLFYVLVYLRDEISAYEEISRVAMAIVLSVIILKTPTYPSKNYASFWVEALPILWLGFIELLYL